LLIIGKLRFQWASLQIDQLLSLERISDIEKRLGKLPKGLKAAYDEIYAAIENQEGSQPDIANRAFQWVMCACQPMSPSELVAAVCQDPENDEPQVIDIDMDFVLGACRNLLLVDRELNVCRFAHLSVQEYFEEHCWSTSQANGLAAKVCLLLLNSPDHWEEPNNSSQRGYGSSYDSDSDSDSDQDNQGRKSYEIDDRSEFVNYVQRFWPIHVQRHGDSNTDDRLSTLLIKFLGSMSNSSPAYRSWYKTYSKTRGHGEDTLLSAQYTRLEPPTLTSLVICLFGFCNILPRWWTVGNINVEEMNENGDSLLVFAALGNSVSIIKKLLEAGADVNAQISGDYGSALAAAAEQGNEVIVRLLLEAGADINAQISGSYGSALAAAAVRGDEETVRLLLEAGADVNAEMSGHYGSVLAAAAVEGNEAAVRLLLEAGADVNAQISDDYGSALAAAAVRGNVTAVKLLLEAGADVNAQISGSYGSALAAAALRGDEAIVKLLLEAGADVNAQLTGQYSTALAVAVAHGRSQATIQLLLDAGADDKRLSSITPPQPWPPLPT
jgi:ankyrin repeat protein